LIDNLLKKISSALDNNCVPYMIIGGQAVLLYGSPRFTRDIDITLGLNIDKFQTIKTLCSALQIKITPENPEIFVKDTMVLPAEDTDSKIRVDFIFSFTPYEKNAISRAKEVMIGGYPVKFASPEDVIVLKMFAGRAIDKEDVKNILLKQTKLDLKYIKKWLTVFQQIPEHKNILNNFEAIRKQAK